MAKKFDDVLSDKNAKAMVDLLLDSDTPETTQMQIITHLITSRQGQGFHKTIYEESLSLGFCPRCQHENHWCVPEDELNKAGYVTHEKDSRVPETTNAENCRDFQQSCKKKKIMI